jgi:hypothetical protein
MPAAIPSSIFEYATSYDPDVEAYLNLQEHQKSLPRSQKLPDGFPLKITGPSAWTPSELRNSYIFHLSELHCAEIESACKKFIG